MNNDLLTEGYKQIKITNNFSSNEIINSVYSISDNKFYIETNKNIYEYKKIKSNKEECSKYADAKCEYSYSLEINKKLNKYKENILNITLMQDSSYKGNSDWFTVITLKNGKMIALDDIN